MIGGTSHRGLLTGSGAVVCADGLGVFLARRRHSYNSPILTSPNPGGSRQKRTAAVRISDSRILSVDRENLLHCVLVSCGTGVVAVDRKPLAGRLSRCSY